MDQHVPEQSRVAGQHHLAAGALGGGPGTLGPAARWSHSLAALQQLLPLPPPSLLLYWGQVFKESLLFDQSARTAGSSDDDVHIDVIIFVSRGIIKIFRKN